MNRKRPPPSDHVSSKWSPFLQLTDDLDVDPRPRVVGDEGDLAVVPRPGAERHAAVPTPVVDEVPAATRPGRLRDHDE